MIYQEDMTLKNQSLSLCSSTFSFEIFRTTNYGIKRNCISKAILLVFSLASFYSVSQTPCNSVTNYGWSSQDIGNVAATGSACTDGTTFRVDGSGSDIWGNQDEFHFVYQQLNGDSEIIARLNSMGNTHGWAKAGIMIRKSLQANSSMGLLSLHPNPTGSGPRLSFQHRDVDSGLMEASTNNYFDDAGSSAPIYLRLVRSGNNLSAYFSYTNNNWNLLVSRSVDLNEDVFVGLAVTSHNDGVINISYFDELQVISNALVPVSGLTLNTSSLSLGTNTTGQLSATVQPSTATNQEVTWSSSNTNIATVNQNGLVNALTSGSAIITATSSDGGFTTQCTVNVNESSANDQKINLIGLNAEQSSLYSNSVASLAIDGNNSGDGSINVTHTLEEENAWWRVDLGATYDLTRIDIYNRTNCCNERLDGTKVYIGSIDSYTTSDFQQVGNNLNGGLAVQQLDFAARGRYILVSQNDIQGTRILSIAELEAYGTLVNTNGEDNISESGNSLWAKTGSTVSLTTSDNVAIGRTSVPNGYKLAVDGNIRTREVRVDTESWPDYVFKEDYKLPSLEEIQNHINEKGHLPNIPSAAEVEANGLELGEMNRLLLEKIEELTLYILAIQKENDMQQLEIDKLKSNK